MRTRGHRARIWRHDAGDLLHGAGARVDVGAAQLGREQMPAAEDVERQIAVAVVIAVKEPPLLVPMDRVVRRIQIQGDLLGRPRMRLQEEVDEQARDRLAIMADAVIARGFSPGGVLQPVQGRLAGERSAIGAAGRELSAEHRQNRIMPELVMVDEVLIAERDPEDALADEGRQLMLDQVGVAGILKAGGEALDQAEGAICRPEQQRPGIGGDRPACERGHHRAPLDRCKQERIRVTLCRHRGAPLA